MVRSLLVVGMVVMGSVAASAQTSSAPHSGGFSPFRGRGFAGGDGGAALGIPQEGCPLSVEVTAIRREERGIVLTVLLENTSDSLVTSETLAVLAFAVDGTPRAAQRQKLSLRLDAGGRASTDIVIRGVTLTQVDVTAVAVQEVGGAASWKVDGKVLERQARSALWP